jgi:cobyrinic acid a,c-diamide synthase
LARAVIIAAPCSGSGKTVLTLALLRAFRRRGVAVASAKAGPDYIDPRFHAAASGRPCYNLDVWAMPRPRLYRYLRKLADGADLIIIEGVMGLFDGPEAGLGSTADLADMLGTPVALVVDCSAMAQSIAPLVEGFASFGGAERKLALILNRVASDRHERVLRNALGNRRVLAAIRRAAAFELPSRHLGLVQASEHPELEAFLERAADRIEASLDLDELMGFARELGLEEPDPGPLPPLGRRIALAQDAAFAFAYPHLLDDWRDAGADLLPFSPLADEAPTAAADAVFLPGGYPELHAGRLARNSRFLSGLRAAAQRGALIYGECGGYMVLGEGLIDAAGTRHPMAGLLPTVTSFADRKLHLGYRQLETAEPLPLGRLLSAHEFHYSTEITRGAGRPLFEAVDARGEPVGAMGLARDNVMGSFAHILA